MTSAIVSQSAPTALPGLDHLRGNVQNWEAAVRTLSLTAAALAESVADGAPPKRVWPATAAAAAAAAAAPEQEAAPRGAPTPAPSLVLLRPPAPPSLLLLPSHLKPGRVFVVANLQGAYYTLLELLARHKFDFRVDNLMHTGNLVAPPAPVPAPAATAGGGHSGLQQQQQQQQQRQEQQSGSAQSRRCRNSTSVLKLVRRHGGLGPMGANECLALLLAARANRQRAAQAAAAVKEEEGRRRLGSALGVGVLKAPGGRCSALSLQLAAAAAASPVQRCCGGRPAGVGAAASASAAWRVASDRVSGSSGGSAEDSEDDGEECVREEGDVEMVAAPLTPHPGGADHVASPDSLFAPPSPLTSHTPPPPPAGGACGAAAASVRSSLPSLDDAGLAQMMSMPACVVLEAYGIRLQHAGPRLDCGAAAAAAAAAEAPVFGADGEGRFHVLFSHRRLGGIPAGAGGGDAVATGLASGRGDVVRFAVLPPLRTLWRRSPGFGAAMAAAVAPSRAELMLEVMEEPLSELDV